MDLLAALDRIAVLERKNTALLCAVRSARHLLGSFDRFDADEIFHLSDLLDRAEVMQ